MTEAAPSRSPADRSPAAVVAALRARLAYGAIVTPGEVVASGDGVGGSASPADGLGAAAERLATEAALGRVAAVDLRARYSSPAHRAAAMDGITVRAADLARASESSPVELRVVRDADADAPPGAFAWVDTGSALPPWADAVVMREQLTTAGGVGAALPRGAASSEIDRVVVRAPVAAGKHVRAVGEDFQAGDVLVAAGERLRWLDVGALLAGGVVEVTVRRAPRVAIVATGDELVAPGTPPEPGQVVESNSGLIAALVRARGGEPLRLPPVGDSLASLQSALRDGLARADVVCLLAGSAGGRRDFGPEAIASVAEVLFQGIDLVPGRPAIVALAGGTGPTGASDRPTRPRLVLGVPGYPVSAALVAREILGPVLDHLLGLRAPVRGMERPEVAATLAEVCASRAGVEEQVRVRLAPRDALGDEPEGGAPRWVAWPMARGAGSISSLSRADGILRLGPDVVRIEAGTRVVVELLRDG